MSAKVQEIFTQIFLTEVRRPPTVVTHYLSHRDEADPFRHLRLILDAETNTLLLREPTLSEALSAFVGIGPASFMMVVLYLAEHPELMSNVEKEEMNRIITIYNERHLKQVPMLG